MKSKSQQGVALVITLILLSVITFMTVTFLVVSRHERQAVSTLSNQRDATFAANAALAQAEGQMVAQMLAANNGQNFGLMVSTNYNSPAGYVNTGPTLAITSVTNVGYTYFNGTPLNNSADLLQNLNNLQILPRPPVFITTNKFQTTPPDFRYYLDLNRNGVYDTNGIAAAYDGSGNFLGSNVFVGDPEWIGVLDKPEFRHSSSNFFIGRYAFIALPIGNSLDINYIHNQAKFSVATPGSPTFDGFLRNQGVGSWEINLAGFLYFLNTNQWGNGSGYTYQYSNANASSSGNAFADAANIVSQRYGGSYNNLNSANQLYGTPGMSAFNGDDIDRYAVGVLGIDTHPLPVTLQNPTKPWAGANNPQRFFDSQDLFNLNLAGNSVGFTNHLYSAGTNITKNSYDRYTFYNLLSQMSWESAPESAAKLNINYKNVNGFSATNFVSWNNALEFFTNAANGLLQANSNILASAGYPPNLNVSNIPVYPTNYYTPAIHRLLQLAANIYDASTNRYFGIGPADTNGYPSVFRPIFTQSLVNGTNVVYISGYAEVTTNPRDYLANPISLPESLSSVPFAGQPQPANAVNIYGIPWVVGVKKGYPNFNEFSMANVSQITRKLFLHRASAGATTFTTNQMYVVGVSNVLGLETWNSYTNSYGRDIDVLVTNDLTMSLMMTNYIERVGQMLLSNNHMMLAGNLPGAIQGMTIPAGGWAGFPHASSPGANVLSFQVPLYTNVIFLPDSTYQQNPPALITNNSQSFETLSPAFPLPHFILGVTNHIRCILRDSASRRIIDYVQLDAMDTTNDLMAETVLNDRLGVWDTNRVAGSASESVPLNGIASQISISLGGLSLNGNATQPNDWTTPAMTAASSQDVANEITGFKQYFAGTVTNLDWQVPFTPTKKQGRPLSLQANDPLVHYTVGDLKTGYLNSQTNQLLLWQPPNAVASSNVLSNLRMVNVSYLPWGNVGNTVNYGDSNKFNLTVKDPAITKSDDWEFPTNKFPNVGWLGRVHRGTPWQTVYLKSPAVDAPTWRYWGGNDASVSPAGNSNTNLFSGLSMPTNDWKIFDVFTTAPNDNASHGQLSVNQTNLAAWAAILQGVITLTNDTGSLQPLIIDPVTNYVAFTNLVAAINTQRSNYLGQVFTNVGSILSVSNLTVASPFLNMNNVQTLGANGLNDAAIERLPEQIMSLLKVGEPRYVIYSYGQSLKPADRSIWQQSGPYFGMCTNYQITGETVTRTVLRIENQPFPGTPLTQPRVIVESFNVIPPE